MECQPGVFLFYVKNVKSVILDTLTNIVKVSK